LNVIEHVWGMMRRALSSLAIGSEAELKAALTTIWMGIPQDALDSLVDSFHYLLRLLTLHGGASLNPFLRHGQQVAIREEVDFLEEVKRRRESLAE
jgi:hypothetical protein